MKEVNRILIQKDCYKDENEVEEENCKVITGMRK